MARRRASYRTGSPNLDRQIADLLTEAGITHNEDLVFEVVVSALRMGRESRDRGDLKLVNSAVKELRYSFLVFEPYAQVPKVSIFGSARILPDDPAYEVARDFGRMIADRDWMVITGAGPGIMEAGIEGAGADRAFGVNIVLPFEQDASAVIAGDPKLINYRYFFTRKITFMKESKAFALLPGGFGTMDEAFELLTLMQTGRSPICPVVLIEPETSTYWDTWLHFVRTELIKRRGLIGPDDLCLVKHCPTVRDAVEEIVHFYSRYHSMRLVGRRLVVRLHRAVSDEELADLNTEFADIVAEGQIERTSAAQPEIEDEDVPTLARLAFVFDRIHYVRLRQLIDRLNGPLPASV
jgi:uncharacterized protein (TIGR00730 family)